MDSRTIGMQAPARRLWAGLDWGDRRHSVSVVDDARAPRAQFEVDAGLGGLRELASRLHGLGAVAGVAVESTTSLVVEFLHAAGFAVYPVNPKLSKNWREGSSVAGVKSDRRDGLVLAQELARRHESLRVLRPAPAEKAALAALCEKQRDLIQERTALVQRLKAALKAYHPAALDFFSDWASPAAWRFVARFPTPESLARARRQTVLGFLKANRIGLSPLWLERAGRLGEAADWPRPAGAPALEIAAKAAVAQLHALQKHIDMFDSEIKKHVEGSGACKVLGSLPGAGDRLAPALAAMAGLVDGEDDMLRALRCLSGVAPVQNQSGRRSSDRMRRRCNKHWRNTLHLFAHCSTRHCAWAAAFYRLCRERGDTFATALRKLADKWLKIIHRMLQTGEAYDDGRHVQALKKNGSPVYLRLCGKTVENSGRKLDSAT